jgi:hypothetical protein
MLNQIDLHRLIKLKQDIALLSLRFPVATIARRTGFNKGSVSRVLNGKEPCSDNFANSFYTAFRNQLTKWPAESSQMATDATQSEKLQAAANTLSELAALLYTLAQSLP